MSQDDILKRAKERALAGQAPQAAPPTSVATTRPAPTEPAPEDPNVNADTEEKLGGTPLRQIRAAVEARCTPLDIGQMILTGTARQAVEILPGKLTVTFRTMTTDEEAWVNLQVSKLGRAASEVMITGTLSRLSLALSIEAVNGESWGATLNSKGDMDLEVIEQREKKVKLLPLNLAQLLGLNLAWFGERVTAALTLDAIKNG